MSKAVIRNLEKINNYWIGKEKKKCDLYGKEEDSRRALRKKVQDVKGTELP